MSTTATTQATKANVNESRITSEEYSNLNDLLDQFCKVPLLEEFSRPVALLHPDLIPTYNKVVKNPIDLSIVCKAVWGRQYSCKKDIYSDVMRIFDNCIHYHTHPLTQKQKKALPDYVSISYHLKEYFDALWMEFMIPSHPNSAVMRNAVEKRKKVRAERYKALFDRTLSPTCIFDVSKSIDRFVEMGGRVDHLDNEKIYDVDIDDERVKKAAVKSAISIVFKSLSAMAVMLQKNAEKTNKYTVEKLVSNLKRCIGEKEFLDMPWLRIKLEQRLDCLLEKILASLYEATFRGVAQSCIWGCMAALVWVKKAEKGPYWPALSLGVLDPESCNQGWQHYLIEKNEKRFPPKLLKELQTEKKKILNKAFQYKNKARYHRSFLVEFIEGDKHDFNWVKETSVIVDFDPSKDVTNMFHKRKHQSSTKNDRLAAGKTLALCKKTAVQNAIKTGKLALDEFKVIHNNLFVKGIEIHSFATLRSDEEPEQVAGKRSTGVNSNLGNLSNHSHSSKNAQITLNDSLNDKLEEAIDSEENPSSFDFCRKDDKAEEAADSMGNISDSGNMSNFGNSTNNILSDTQVEVFSDQSEEHVEGKRTNSSPDRVHIEKEKDNGMANISNLDHFSKATHTSDKNNQRSTCHEFDEKIEELMDVIDRQHCKINLLAKQNRVLSDGGDMLFAELQKWLDKNEEQEKQIQLKNDQLKEFERNIAKERRDKTSISQKLFESEKFNKILKESNDKLKVHLLANAARKDSESEKTEERKIMSTIEDQSVSTHDMFKQSNSSTMASSLISVSSPPYPAPKRQKMTTGRNGSNCKGEAGSILEDKIARLQAELKFERDELQMERTKHTETHNQLCQERTKHTDTLKKLDCTKCKLWELES